MAKWNPNKNLAVVTGASSGIGRCLVLQLLASGCRVIAVARRENRLQSLRLEASDLEDDSLVLVAGDITDHSTHQAILNEIESRGGQLGLLVNNAGIGGIGPFENASPERLRQIMEVNFFAPVELTRSLLPALKQADYSVLCNVGSVLGHRAVPDKSEYCASKFAMHGWTDALRAELADSNVSVVLVSPSTTSSEFFDSLVETDSGARSKSMGSWTSQRVAKATLSAIRRRRSETILSAGGKLLVYADRICPPLMNWVLKKRS